MVLRHSTLCRFKKAVIAVVKFQANTHTHLGSSCNVKPGPLLAPRSSSQVILISTVSVSSVWSVMFHVRRVKGGGRLAADLRQERGADIGIILMFL